MAGKNKTFRNFVAAPIVVIVYFVSVSIITFLIDGKIGNLINYLSIGIIVAGGMTFFAFLPKKKKRTARMVAFITLGGMLFLFMGVMGRINAQIEGFFFYAMAGVFIGAISHYLVAKIIGPLIISRAWCSWGCWTAMVLDLLPYKRGAGRLRAKWDRLRYVHFALSLGVVALLFYGFGYSISKGAWDINAMYWFVGGNVVYYALAVVLAFTLKDNRAFCKYVCPITVFLKTSGSFALLRIKGDNELCSDCGTCEKSCPMDVRVPEYHKSGKRVLSNECVLCLTCVNVCPNGTLRTSVGLDAGFRGLLRVKEGDGL